MLVTLVAAGDTLAAEMIISLKCCRLLVVLVTLSLLIKIDSQSGEFQSLQCPARKQLIDVVRPMLNRKLPQTPTGHVDPVLVKLDIRGAHEDICWTSEAHCFKVSFVSVFKCCCSYCWPHRISFVATGR